MTATSRAATPLWATALANGSPSHTFCRPSMNWMITSAIRSIAVFFSGLTCAARNATSSNVSRVTTAPMRWVRWIATRAG